MKSKQETKVGIYARLSRDDDSKTESESIKNQNAPEKNSGAFCALC